MPKISYKPHHKMIIRHAVDNPCTAVLVDMGLGKTACMLRVYELLRARGKVKNCLVVAPLQVALDTWAAEIEKWGFDITYTILHGTKKDKNFNKDVDFYLMNFEGLAWYDRKGACMDMLIIDESTKVKNTSTIRYRILKRDMLNYEYRYCLTGKPAPNGLQDLFGQMYLVGGDAVLGRNITHFRQMYCTRGYHAWDWRLRAGAAEEIYEAIKPWSICMRSEDYLTLPDRTFNYVDVTLPADAKKIYDEIESTYIMQVDDTPQLLANAGAVAMKLRQVANGAVYTDSVTRDYKIVHSAKTDKIKQMIAELNGEPVLILYEFKHDLEALSTALGDTPNIGGDVSHKVRSKHLTAWNAGKLPVLLANAKSVGHGLNLQSGGHTMIWFSIPYDLDVYDQANKRLHRPGQTNNVFIHHIVARGTIDDTIVKILAGKDRAQSSLLNALKKRFTHAAK